ncbi:hypothetical protein F4808DRAFT_420490 [Astrocystis sublimbata]|nr:hypothetical protein F4808DRAFT_420490 [Astrocystis sublimbata]
MSFGRTYLPAGIAILFGIVNGYYAFQPLLKEQQEKRDLVVQPKSEQQTGAAPNDSGPK